MQHAYVAEVEDLSSLSYLEFWQRMAKAGRVWRYGPQVGVQVMAAEKEGQKKEIRSETWIKQTILAASGHQRLGSQLRR